MAFCANCGFQNPDGARFCGNCGADLAQQEVGNVESIVNESTGTAAPDNNPMDYVPLPTSEPEVNAPTFEPDVPPMSTPTPQPTEEVVPPPAEPVFTPTPQPEAPVVPPVTPPTPQPTPPPTPQPTPAPPAAPQQVVVQAGGPAQPARPVPPKSSGGGAGKTCLGCGCAAGIVILLILGGLTWWGYSIYKQHGEDLDEVLEWIDKSHAEWEEKNGVGNEDPNTQTYNGKTLKLLAEEQGLPSVTYDERPSEGPSYFNDESELAVRFNYLKFKEGDYIGIMTVSDRSSGDVQVFRFSPCGCSIYHLNYPADPDVDGYLFVYKGARRVVISDNEEVKEFVLPEVDDEEVDDEVDY